GQVGAVGGDAEAGQHELTVAINYEPPHLSHKLVHRQRARISASVGDDAEGAAMIAAILHLHKCTGSPLDAVDRVRPHRFNAHDVGDRNFRASGPHSYPSTRIKFLLIVDALLHS